MRLCKWITLLLFPVLLSGLLLSCGQPTSPASEPSPAVAVATTAAAIPTSTSTVPTTTEAVPAPTRLPTVQPSIKPTTVPATRPAATTNGDGRVVLADGFYAVQLDAALKARITGLSYPADVSSCKTRYEDLRYIRLLHYDFAGKVQTGEIIVNVKLAREVMQIFYALYQAKYPLTSVRLVDDYGEAANDDLSMAANNTSGFCYRYVYGTKTLSQHSYGAAIDINPQLNPYIVGDRVAPPNGAEYVDRTREFTGKIDHDDLCYKLFRQYGWSWGGDWNGDKDYQHFSKKLA